MHITQQTLYSAPTEGISSTNLQRIRDHLDNKLGAIIDKIPMIQHKQKLHVLAVLIENRDLIADILSSTVDIQAEGDDEPKPVSIYKVTV